MGYSSKKVKIETPRGKMKLIILSPDDSKGKRPGVLWIHGGGYVTGMAEMVHFTRGRTLAEKLNAVVVSPGYRLAPRNPYPAAILDCHRALKYMLENSESLGIRTDQIIVGGESAGGGLTAALCMYERDVGGIKIAFQLPLYPMLDCEDTESSRNNYSIPWNTPLNHISWKMYLRGIKGNKVPIYASPSRCCDYSDLPPAYTFVAEKEPFYCETVKYIENLNNAGVPGKVKVYPGLFHAFDMLAPYLPVSWQAEKNFEIYAERYMRSFFAENNK